MFHTLMTRIAGILLRKSQAGRLQAAVLPEELAVRMVHPAELMPEAAQVPQ